jgi:cytochrome P450
MNSYIRKELMQRFEEAIRERLKDHPTKSMPTKSVIGLALQAYLGDDQTITASKRNKPDEKFIEYATWQIRLFLFAGTDTTATILVYLYHVLAKHPTWLRKLREEHDQVFGKVPSEAAKILKENPNLLNSCRLTIAVIKEALRLYGPARSIRSGLPGITITDLQGNKHPMHYVGANILHQALHLNHRVWPKTEEFLPERFLVGPEHELYPNTLAFRPFEQGPRNCIGQTLVWNELKIALVLTCRELDIKDAYADFDAQRESNMGLLERTKQWMFGKPSTTLHGERAYQTDSGGLHPVDGYPCYVSWAKN